jgi:hypothetical protein
MSKINSQTRHLKAPPLGAIFCLTITLLSARADVALFSPARGDVAGTSVEATFGWSFSVGTTSLQVTGLGIWDEGNNGLIGAHPVGLWNSSGTVLATTIIPAGTAASLLGEYRFVSLLNPIVLSASETYVIGASYDNDDVLDHPCSTLPEVAPHLTVVQARYLLEAPFGLPVDGATFLPAAYVGPNFEYTVVPEPPGWSLALLGVCALVIGKYVKRRPVS